MALSKYNTLKQHEHRVVPKKLKSGLSLCKVEHIMDSPNNLHLSDNTTTCGTCLRCPNMPCLKFANAEITLPTLNAFPCDSNNDVCPTGAITWPLNSETPIINSELCIGCGLCASRCPSHAIYYTDDGTAKINIEENKYFVNCSDQKDFFDALKTINSPTFINAIKELKDNSLVTLYDNISNKSNVLTGNSPNLFIRNLLLLLNVKSGIRRTGDNYTRMDIVFEDTVTDIRGIGEIEFGLDILNTPRNILDNIAVFASRYNIKNVLPVIFPFILPNQRSEYWQVIKDIQKVLNVRIVTITVGILTTLLWNKSKLTNRELNNFYSDCDNYSNKDTLVNILGRQVDLEEGLHGIIAPRK